MDGARFLHWTSMVITYMSMEKDLESHVLGAGAVDFSNQRKKKFKNMEEEEDERGK